MILTCRQDENHCHKVALLEAISHSISSIITSSYPPAGITPLLRAATVTSSLLDSLDLVGIQMLMPFTLTVITALKMVSIILPSGSVLLSLRDSGSQLHCTLESQGPLKYNHPGHNPPPRNHHLWRWEPGRNVVKKQPRLRNNTLGPIAL